MVVGDCTKEQTNLSFSEYGLLTPLCLNDNEQQKLISLKKEDLFDIVADFILPYSEVQQALSLGSDIEQVRTLLRQSAIAQRIVLSSISDPDSKLDGYISTLIRLYELEQDVQVNPDGSGKLTPVQEEARREYLVVLRTLWEKQHDILLNLAGHTARYILSGKAFSVANNFARPYTEVVSARINGVTTPVALFLKNAVTH